MLEGREGSAFGCCTAGLEQLRVSAVNPASVIPSTQGVYPEKSFIIPPGNLAALRKKRQ
jgi:hypothetical protein